MTNRRHFLAGSMASAVYLASFSARAASQLADPGHSALAGFVFDDRFEHGTTMSRCLDQRVTQTYAVQGDVSEVWYDHLARSLKDRPHAIGGLTTAGELFVLSRLGHDAGLTLALHGRHRFVDDGQRVEHELKASPWISKQFASALARGLSWTSALQGALHEVASRPPADRLPLLDIGVSERSRQVTLHSWLLTPRG